MSRIRFAVVGLSPDDFDDQEQMVRFPKKRRFDDESPRRKDYKKKQIRRPREHAPAQS